MTPERKIRDTSCRRRMGTPALLATALSAVMLLPLRSVLAQEDFTGHDLTGRDFSGRDLENALRGGAPSARCGG